MIARPRPLAELDRLIGYFPVVALQGPRQVGNAGPDTFPLADRVRALALPRLWNDLDPLG